MGMPPKRPDYTIPNAAWSGHHLILADEELVDTKIRRPLLSPSIAAGYNSCPASVVVNRLQPWDDDPFAANTMGTAAHFVMETLMSLRPEERTLERALDILKKSSDEQWSITKLEKQNNDHLLANAENRTLWHSTIEKWIRAVFLIIDPPTVEVESTEFLLDNIKIGKGVGGSEGIPLKGYVDLTEWIVRDGRRIRLIDDWKFGKAKVKVNPRYGDDYGDQQRIYYAGYAESTGEMPAGARLIFPRGIVDIDADPSQMSQRQRESLTIRNIDVSPNEMRKTLLGFRAGWNTMNESADRRSFEARPSGLCGWCPAANSCPVAKLPNQKALDAAKGQPSALQLGIPTLRPGASLQEVRDAPGVTVPLSREPDFDTTIEPAGDDMFPITLLEDGETEESVRADASPAPAASVTGPELSADEPPFDPFEDPPFDPFYIEPQPDPIEAVIPDEIVPEPVAETAEISAVVNAMLTTTGASVSADDPFAAEWFRAVHVGAEGTSNTEGDQTTMNENHSEHRLDVKPEAAPYEAEINGMLNLNSYSAIAVSGIVALAFEHMRSQDVRVSPVSLNRFSQVLAGIVLRVQKQTTGFQNFQSGANTRLRGFLRMAIEAFPAPFRVRAADGTALIPATLQDWQQWTGRIENLLSVSIITAVDLYDSAAESLNSSPEAFFAAGGEGAPTVLVTN